MTEQDRQIIVRLLEIGLSATETGRVAVLKAVAENILVGVRRNRMSDMQGILSLNEEATELWVKKVFELELEDAKKKNDSDDRLTDPNDNPPKAA